MKESNSGLEKPILGIESEIERQNQEVDSLAQEVVSKIIKIQSEGTKKAERYSEDLEPGMIIKRILEGRGLSHLLESSENIFFLSQRLEMPDTYEGFLRVLHELGGSKNRDLLVDILEIEKEKFRDHFVLKEIRGCLKRKEYDLIDEINYGNSKNPIIDLYVSVGRLLDMCKKYRVSIQSITDKIKNEVVAVSGDGLVQNPVLIDVLYALGGNWSLENKNSPEE